MSHVCRPFFFGLSVFFLLFLFQYLWHFSFLHSGSLIFPRRPVYEKQPCRKTPFSLLEGFFFWLKWCFLTPFIILFDSSDLGWHGFFVCSGASVSSLSGVGAFFLIKWCFFQLNWFFFRQEWLVFRNEWIVLSGASESSLSGVGTFFVYTYVCMVFCVYVYVCGASKHEPTTDRDEMRWFFVFMRFFFLFTCMYLVRQDDTHSCVPWLIYMCAMTHL